MCTSVNRMGQHWFSKCLAACFATSHFKNQCWLTVNCILTNDLQWNSYRNTTRFIQEHLIKPIVCKLSLITFSYVLLPVDANWATWAEWTQCNMTCGGGWRSRQRDCNAALFGGADCMGESSQTEACNEEPCPGKCCLLFCRYGREMYALIKTSLIIHQKSVVRESCMESIFNSSQSHCSLFTDELKIYATLSQWPCAVVRYRSKQSRPRIEMFQKCVNILRIVIPNFKATLLSKWFMRCPILLKIPLPFLDIFTLKNSMKCPEN